MRGLPTIFLVGLTACAAAPTFAQAPNQAHSVVTTSGALQRLNSFFTLNPDCTSVGYPTVRILVPPVNGRLYAQQATDYPDYPVTNQRYSCNLKKAPGTIVSYQSNPGYVGADSVTIEVLYPSGSLRVTQYNIVVR